MSEHEFEIIERYFKVISKSSAGVVLGPGDDCAVLAFPGDTEVCVSTDTLIEEVHFPANCSAAMVASRLVGSNLSDLAAMGAVPHSCLIAMTMPEADPGWLAEFSETLSQLIDQYGLSLVGGNISRGELSLTMTVLGTVPVGEALTRQGARPGDSIYVTGTLGDAGQGLTHLLSGRDPGGFLTSRYRTPTPRLEAGCQLRGIATAMIDISDGLVADLGHLCRESQVGAVVELTSVPVSDDLVAALGDVEARCLALTAGDDYELCFTAPGEAMKRLRPLAEASRLQITQVGRIGSDGGIDVLDAEGNCVEIGNPGYLHFS